MKHFNMKSGVVPWGCSSGLHELHVSGSKMCLFFFFSFCNFTFYFSLWKSVGQRYCSSVYMQKYSSLRSLVLLKITTNKERKKKTTQEQQQQNNQIPNKINLILSACGSVLCDVWMFIKPMVILHNDILFVLTIFCISVTLNRQEAAKNGVVWKRREGMLALWLPNFSIH